MDQIQNQLSAFVGGLSIKQRLMFVGAALVTLGVLIGFVRLIAAPDYKPLVTGMEQSDAEALSARLAAKNIPYELSSDGKTVSVPSDKIDSSRMDIAAEGMPHSGRLGLELFDKLNWGQTEFDEKVNYQRGLEGELERSIQTLHNIESVRVHLVMPTDSVFLDHERSAKASVVLKLRSGTLSPETQSSIAHLVSGAVDKLSPDDVTVIDADTKQPLDSKSRNPLSPADDLDKELNARLLQTLGPIVGPDRVRASVNVEYDPSSSEENDETYDPKSAVAVSSQRSEESVGAGLNGGVPGTSSNVPGGSAGTKPAVDDGDSSQVSKSESNTYAVNKVVRHTIQPAGRIRRLTAALLVDDAVESKLENGKVSEIRHKRSPQELKQIEELAKAAIGVDLSRGDTLTVQNLSFEQPAVETLAKPTNVERIRTILNDWSSYVRYATILLLFLLAYLLLLRPLKKQLIATFRELPARVAAASQLKGAQSDSEGGSLTAEQQRAAALNKQLVEKVREEPATTSRLIQSWIHEGAK
jgi:flagellar M-ring protein FliF